MLLTRCPRCKCDFEVTEDDLEKEYISCPTCGLEGAWDRNTGYDIRLPKLAMVGRIEENVG